jgi:hypothetical protein
MSGNGLCEYTKCEVDKDNNTRKTLVGHYIVCVSATKLVPSDLSFKVGDFEVYDSAANADARIEKLKAIDASGAGAVGSANRSDPSNEEGYITHFDSVKRQDLHHITSKWEDLCPSPAHSVPVPHPLVGTVFETLLLRTLLSSADSSLVHCKLTVKSVDTTSSEVLCSIEAPDTESMPLAVARMYIARTPIAPIRIGFSTKWPEATHGKFLLNLIKSLPLSSGCAVGETDMPTI